MTPDDIATLYEAYGAMVHRRCRQLLNNEADAADATQDVFLRAVKYGQTFRGEANPLTWLYAIANRRCLDILQQKKLGPTQPPGPSSERPSDTLFFRHELAQLLTRFDQQTQQLVIQYYFDELSQSEIAERNHCSRRTVIAKLNHFRNRSRRILEQWGDV